MKTFLNLHMQADIDVFVCLTLILVSLLTHQTVIAAWVLSPRD